MLSAFACLAGSAVAAGTKLQSGCVTPLPARDPHILRGRLHPVHRSPRVEQAASLLPSSSLSFFFLSSSFSRSRMASSTFTKSQDRRERAVRLGVLRVLSHSFFSSSSPFSSSLLSELHAQSCENIETEEVGGGDKEARSEFPRGMRPGGARAVLADNGLNGEIDDEPVGGKGPCLRSLRG